jgi:hypothetical protein
MKEYKYFLFDLDGVLVDTNNIQYESTKEAIYKLVNYNIETNSDIVDIFNSTITTIEKLEKLYKMNIITKYQVQEIYNLKKKIADDFFYKLDIDLDKINLLKKIKLNSCKIAVVTNGNKKSAEIILKSIGILDFIDILITNEDVVNPKPHPEPYLKAIDFFKANINECIIFEDSEVGLASAKKTGCDIFHVLNYKDVNINIY